MEWLELCKFVTQDDNTLKAWFSSAESPGSADSSAHHTPMQRHWCPLAVTPPPIYSGHHLPLVQEVEVTP